MFLFYQRRQYSYGVLHNTCQALKKKLPKTITFLIKFCIKRNGFLSSKTDFNQSK